MMYYFSRQTVLRLETKRKTSNSIILKVLAENTISLVLKKAMVNFKVFVAIRRFGS